MVTPGFLVDANHAVAECQIIVGRGDLAAVAEFVRQTVEHIFVLGKERVDQFRWVQHAFDAEVSVMFESLQLLGSEDVVPGPRNLG